MLLLTASVQVRPGLPTVTDSVPEEREAEYISSLRFYLTHFPQIRNIVFAENSGWPLEAIVRATRDLASAVRVEYLSFEANSFPPVFAKGYGESLLVDTALSRSTLLNEKPYFAKMTGRHLLRNLAEIVERTGEPFDLLCDVRDHSLYEILRMPHSGHHCDTRFFVVRRDFYDRYFREHYRSHVSGGYSIEGEYFRIIKSLPEKADVIRRFPVEPMYGGTSGHGKDYDAWREKGKRMIRSAARRFVPTLYI